jgi:hypothetical protein
MRWSPWGRALPSAALICLFILGLYYYWFAVADRYSVFLYGHLNATPFDEVTSSRYWMSGLVASGLVMIAYGVVNWVVGRVGLWRKRSYSPPAWSRVWSLCVIPLGMGMLVITMTFNRPTLPFSSAVACVAATLVGLAFALMPGAWAAQRPVDLIWLTFDGMGLMPCLMLLQAVELPGRGVFTHFVKIPWPVEIEVHVIYLIVAGSVLAGIAWLGIVTLLRRWRDKESPTAVELYIAGLCLSYLLMPVVHHLFATPPGYRYITTSSNFFAFTRGVQLAVFVVAALLAMGITRLRRAQHH